MLIWCSATDTRLHTCTTAPLPPAAPPPPQTPGRGLPQRAPRHRDVEVAETAVRGGGAVGAARVLRDVPLSWMKRVSL